MEDQAEVLWRMYNEHVTMGRHHETQRSSTSQIILVVVAALIGFFGSSRATHGSTGLMAVFVISLGLFGALFSAKQYERAKFHMLAAGLHRQALEARVGMNLSRIRTEAETAQALLFPRANAWRLNLFWIRLHLIVAFIGAAMLIRAVYGYICSLRPLAHLC